MPLESTTKEEHVMKCLQRVLGIFGILFCLALVFAVTANADTVALDFQGFGNGGGNYTQGSYCDGFAFTANTPITITQLGYYDANLNGGNDTFGSHAVGLWDLTTNTLLAETTVTSSDPATGYFRYAALSTPISLNTTDTYAVAGITGSSDYTARVPVAAAIGNVPAEINYVSIATWSTDPSSESSTTSTLIEPNDFSWAGGDTIYGPDFGPNFMFASATLPTGTFYGPNNPAITADTPACGEFAGDPVDCNSGNLTETVTDLSVPGRGRALNLTRTYNSQDAASGGSGMFGAGWSSTYGEFLTIGSDGSVTVHQAGGATVTFTSSKTGYTAPSYVTAKFVKNKKGTYTFTLKNQQSDTFDKNGRLISQTDRNDLVTTLAYNSNGLATVTDPAGRRFVFTTASNGLVSKVTDPAGRSVSYAYDTNGNLITVTDAGGGITSFSFGNPSNHLLNTTTDQLGGQVSNLYDSSNRVVLQSDQLGNNTTFSYAAGATNTTTVTDPNGNVSLHTFSNDLLISLTEGHGTGQAATWAYGYDSNLNRISITDANGNVWKAAYDSNGNQIEKIDPLGNTVTTTYTSRNDPAKITDQLGVTTRLTYSSKGDLESSSRPLTGTKRVAKTTFAHGDSKYPGDVTSITDPTGAETTFTYNRHGNNVSLTDPDGRKTTRSFDSIGRMLTSVSPHGNVPKKDVADYTTSYTYDAFGKVLTVTDPLGHKAANTYDAKEELTSFTDRDGNLTSYKYNATGKLVKTVMGDGSVVSNSYDDNGNLVTWTDGNGNNTTFAYDSLDRVITMTDATGRVTAYAHDGNGNRILDTAPDGETVSRTYDAAGRLTGVAYSDAQTHAVTYHYDKTGRRIGMTDGSGASTWQYDSLGRLTKAVNGAGQAVSYSYDLRGLPTRMIYPNNESIKRVYDKDGRLTSVEDWLKNTVSFKYDADGNLVRTAYPHGWTGAYQYDKNDRVTGIEYKKGSSISSFSYTRTNAGLLASEALNSGAPTTYSYDAVSRLVDVSNQVAYTYDDAGRVTAMPAGVTLVYDDADQLSTGKGGTFSYDRRANRISFAPSSGPTLTYTYDGANRLTGYGTTAAYAYDGDGLRVSKTTGSTTEAFVWDRRTRLTAILADGSSYYIYGPGGMPLEQVSSSGAVFFYHWDQLGSIRMITDSKGATAATYAYDVYGNLVSSTGQVSNPFGYAGAYTDAESGLLYMRARYYDPVTAQFISRDPIFAATGQRYAYAGDSPTNKVDPTGLQGCGTSDPTWFPTTFSDTDRSEELKYIYQDEASTHEDFLKYMMYAGLNYTSLPETTPTWLTPTQQMFYDKALDAAARSATLQAQIATLQAQIDAGLPIVFTASQDDNE
jgi:RHS repeat-associated protein